MLSGLVRVVPPASITAIVNVGDDTVLHGLHISPDLDTITYTLAGMDNRETGWGVVGETWTVMEELARLGGESWFRLGDRDLATHLFRTERLRAGDSLSEVTASHRRPPPDRRPPPPGHRRPRSHHADPGGEDRARGPPAPRWRSRTTSSGCTTTWPCGAVRFAGAESARPTPAVLDALGQAEQIVVCPSNPIVSIGPLLAVPGILAALVARRDDVIAVSPIVAGPALKGPADRLMAELGTEPSVVGVARLYAPWVGTLVIDEADRAAAPATSRRKACAASSRPTIMDSPDRAAALARMVIDAGG